MVANEEDAIIQIERGVLGSALCNQSRALHIAALEEDHFQSEQSRAIYRSIVRICDREDIVDELTLAADLEARGESVDANMVDLAIAGSRVDDAAFKNYIKTLEGERTRGMLADIGRKIAIRSNDRGKSPNDLVSSAFADMLALGESKTDGLRLVGDIIRGSTQEELIPTKKSTERVIPTGYRYLDQLTSGGMRPGDLWIVAGRPGMGKSAFGVNIAQHLATLGLSSALFSLEMDKISLIQRMVCSSGMVDHGRFRSGYLNEEECKAARRGLQIVATSPIWIDDRAALTAEEIFAQTKRLSLTTDLRLIVVDYLQLVHTKKKTDRREEEVANVSRTLKKIAKLCGCTVLALAQLNRKSEERKGGTPLLSDLRESGAIEQDADVVLFPFRPEAYEPDNPSLYQLAELLLAKQRGGPTGKAEVQFQGEYVRFIDYEDYQEAA